MATKLFPPAIENKLPAFAGTTLKIPFTQNRAVSMQSVGAMSVVIKTVQTNTVIADNLQGTWSYDDETGQYSASFQIQDYYSRNPSARKISPGQFYKVQLAYVGNDTGHTIGYYSSVGVIKCTTSPTIAIPEITENYYGSREYTGYYSQSGDNQDGSEKVYSYQFYLRDNDGNLLATSGEQIHDSTTDQTTTSSTDSWIVNQALEEGVYYNIQYRVTTMNGLVAQTQGYNILAKDSIDPNLPCELIAIPSYEDGCISLYLRPTASKTITGSFVLSRSSSEDNYSTWNEIYRFAYQGVAMAPRATTTPPSKWDVNDIPIWEDFTTKQGHHYIYALQAYNARGFYSSRVLNVNEYLDEAFPNNPDRLDNYHTIFKHEPIFMDFEDMFLFDGERQLRIRFNPKMSSFKSTILESKMDTLGGKYPFIFRNGNVEYKEFPISGLLSLISDPNERFYKGIQQNLYITRGEAAAKDTDYALDTWLSSNNIRRERQFKMDALAWLTNGVPKLFRSPTEGNFIVRLMNTSLTPNDTLGRMLHTFSSTAYEIAEYTFENLNYYNFIKSPIADNRYLKIAQIQLANIPSEFPKDNNGTITLPDAYFANITEATPGMIIGLNFTDNTGENEIEIGGTGCYYIPFKDKPLKFIRLIKNPNNVNSKSWDGAKLTFCFYDSAPTDEFGSVSDVETHDEVRQFIGTGYPDLAEDNVNLNVINKLTDIRTQPGKFHYIKVAKRPTWICYDQGNKNYSLDPEGNDILSGADWNATIIYEVHDKTTNAIKGYMYGKKEGLKKTKPDYRFSFNGSSAIDMEGNPNELDTFICRECHQVGRQELFFTYDENGNLITDSQGEPILQCPKVHSRRNNVYHLPATHGRIEGLTNLPEVTSLYLGTGVMVDAAFRVKEIIYAVESSDEQVQGAKADYMYAKQDWSNAIADGKSTATIDSYRDTMFLKYDTYISVLTNALERENVV